MIFENGSGQINTHRGAEGNALAEMACKSRKKTLMQHRVALRGVGSRPKTVISKSWDFPNKPFLWILLDTNLKTILERLACKKATNLL